VNKLLVQDLYSTNNIQAVGQTFQTDMKAVSKMNLKLKLLNLILLFPLAAAATDYDISGGWTETNADFRVYEMNLNGETPSHWGFTWKESNGQAQGDNFAILQVFTFKKFHYAGIEWKLAAGGFGRTTEGRQTASFPGGGIEVLKNLGRTDLSLNLAESFFAQDLQTAYAINESLRAPNYKLSGRTIFSERWRGDFYGRQMFLSDGNTRSDQDLAVFYSLSLNKPWFWMGVGGNNLTNAVTNHPYWSPRQFLSYGPRFEATFPISARFTCSSLLNLNHYKNDVFGEGQGFYRNAKLIYKPNDKLRLDLSYEGIESKQSLNPWQSNAIKLGLLWGL
jgi:hypothetical protein